MRWSSRKLWITIGSAILSTALLAVGLISDGVWQVVFLGTVGVYITSQAGVDGVEKYKSA